MCISILGPLVAAALLESFLWVAAFGYCFAKAYKKADQWSQKLMAGFMTVAFTIIRYDLASDTRNPTYYSA